MKKILITFLILFLPILSFAQESSNPIVEFTEEDASPSTYPYKVKFPNSSVTDNLDGTASISFTGALDTIYLQLSGSNQSSWTPTTTLVTNLNADLWDGYQFSDYLDQAVKTTSSPTFNTVNFGSATGVSATAASGKLTLSGIGNTNNESLLLDFETTADTIYLSPNQAEILVRPNTGFDYAYFYNGSSFTDRTSEAKTTQATAYTVVADNADFFYVGMTSSTFTSVYFDFNAVAVGGTTLVVEYSKGGSSWGTLSVTDGTSLFTQDGAVTFTAPLDWATNTVNSSSAYWVRFSTSTSTTTDPTAYITTRSNGSGFLSIYGNDGDNANNLILNIDKNGIGSIYLTGGDVTIERILTASADGISILNSNAATATSTVKISPRLRFRAQAWNTSSLASEINQFIIEALPVSGNPTSCNLNISAAAAGAGSYTNVFSLTSAGALTLLDTALIDGTLTLATGSITDSSGAISFDNENLSTTGTLGAGAITGTSFISGANTLTTGNLLDGTKVANADLGEISVSSGVWSVDSGSILLSELGGGAAGANAYDFGGATSLEIPNGANPTVDADGEIAYDSNDENISVYDGSASRAINTVIHIEKAVLFPEYVQPDIDDIELLDVNSSWAPFGIKLVNVGIKTNASSSYTVAFQEWTDATTFSSTIESVATVTSTEANTSGASIDDSDIASGNIIKCDLPTTTGVVELVVFADYWIKTGN